MEITKELLEDLYIKQNLSPKTIKGILGCSKNSVKKYLEEFGIEKKNEEQIYTGVRDTCLRRFGTISYSQTEEYKSRVKQTSLQKFGVEYYTQTRDYKKRYKQTCLEKYGVENASKSEQIKQKAKETCLEKYNAVGPMGNEQIKEKANKTYKEKYGCHPRSTKEVQDKYKQTCLEKYGVENYSQTKEYKNRMNYLFSQGIIQQKEYLTKNKNQSFCTSGPEERCYQLLIQKFGQNQIIRQYRNSLYPWKCDFYIKSQDLYIECQFSPYHYKEPFNPNNKEHQERFKTLQEKDKLYSSPKQNSRYKSMIITWTKRDLLKRETAKKNNLNWVEFFNEQDLYKYFN